MTHVFKENLEDTSSLLVDEAGDTLDTTTAGKTTNGGLGDTLNVVTKDLAVTLSTTLSETLGGRDHISHKPRCGLGETGSTATHLATLSTARHV